MDELAFPEQHDMSLVFSGFFLQQKLVSFFFLVDQSKKWLDNSLLTIFAAKNSPVFFFSTILG